MIEFNKILNPRLVAPLVRLFAMKIGGSPAPTLAPEVAPSLDVNQQDDATLFFIRNERLMGTVLVVAASVGNIGKAQIRNPTNSGVLLVVKSVYVISATSVNLGVGVLLTDEANVRIPQPRDGRWYSVGGSRGTAVVSDGATAAPTSFLSSFVNSNNVDKQVCEFVVAPGQAFTATGNTANVGITIGLEWVERPVGAEELSIG